MRFYSRMLSATMITKKKNPGKVTITLSFRELEILTYIQAEEGQSTISGVIHNCIRSQC